MSAHIKDGDMAKVGEIFPDKFVFIYVVDRATGVGDLAASMKTDADIKMAKTLIHRITLGDNGRPKGLN